MLALYYVPIGKPSTSIFYVVPDDFDIPCEAILGATYLTETNAVIDYENESMKTN